MFYQLVHSISRLGCLVVGETPPDGKLGNPKGAKQLAGRGNVEAVRAIKSRADCKAAKLKGQVDAMRAEGHSTLTAIAGELTRRGIVTSRGGAWYPMGVKRLLNRFRNPVGNGSV